MQENVRNERLQFVESPLVTGDEVVLPGATVRDSWAWALGDLRLHSTRGMLAQFLVAKAVSDPRPRDDGWGDFDVLTPENIKVEVKSSRYLQSWTQLRPSRINFSGLKGRTWAAEVGYSAEREFRADVYVFAVHTCQNPAAYDPLELTAWEFYVLPGPRVRELGQNSLGLSKLRALAPVPVAWAGLCEAVRRAANAGVEISEAQP